MEEFKKINWYMPQPGSTFLEDDYLFENSVTFKLLNDQLVSNVVPRNNWKLTNEDHEEDEAGGRVHKKQKTTKTTEQRAGKEKEAESDEDNSDAVDDNDASLSRLSIDDECSSTRWEPKDFNTNKKSFAYIAGVRPNLPFPRTSSLTADEQAQYIKLRAKFFNTNLTASTLLTAEESRHFMTYKALSDRVTEEQTEFNKFLKDQWSAHQVKFYVLDTDIVRYTNETWKHRLKQVAGYLPYYDRAKTIPLTFQGQDNAVQLIPGQILLQLGVVPLVRRPKFTHRVQIPQNYTKMCERYPPDNKLPDGRENNAEELHKLPVSQDRNAQLLAEAYGADIVVSASGLKHIANNLAPYDRTWDLPVVVKEYRVQNTGTQCGVSKRVVYVDKALAPKAVTVTERNQWYHKAGVKLVMCHPKDKQAYRFPYSNATSETPDISGSPVADTGTGGRKKRVLKESTPAAQQKHCKFVRPLSPQKNEEMQWSGDEDSDALFIATDVEESEAEGGSGKRAEPLRRSSRRATRAHDVTITPTKTWKASDVSPETTKVPTKSNASRQSPLKPCFSVPSSSPAFSNVTYQLWTLRQTADVDLQHMSSKLMKQSANTTAKKTEIRILVRTKLDGCERDRDRTGVLPVCLSPKLEYQSEFGAEKVTKAGLIREWLSMLFRPRSTLFRVGIHAETSEVLLLTVRSMDQLTLECKQTLGFNALPKITSTLYNVLLNLIDLTAGQYLLSHTPTMEAFLLLQKGNPEYGSFNLPKVYSLVNPSEASVPGSMPWTAVDVNVMMPYHTAFARVPATFHPCRYHKDVAKTNKGTLPPTGKTNKGAAPSTGKTGKTQVEKNKEKRKRKRVRKRTNTGVI